VGPETRFSRRWVVTRETLRALAAAVSGLALFFVFAFLVAAAVLWRTASEFAGYAPRQPSRLYAQPMVLRVGDSMARDELTARLRQDGYRPAPPGPGLPGGSYRETPQLDSMLLVSRGALPPDAELHPTAGIISVRFAADAISELSESGAATDQVALEPALLAAYYGPELRECRPVALDRLPRHVIDAVLAAEDAGFFHHPGLSAAGIARAAVVNWVAGRIEQGGSTITQQLVRNLYLSQERTWARKAREAWLSLIVEMRYAKEPILEAYLNEIYLGRRGKVNLIGVGAAAHALFGKSPERLSLEEAAMIAALIQSPGDHDPVAHPKAALARRNWVLERMAAGGFITAARAGEAASAPLHLAPLDLPGVYDSPAPHFAGAMAAEARRRFGVEDLQGAGYELRSTLRSWDQEQARVAVAEGLAELEGGRRAAPGLEAALVALDPRDGAVAAWVGGRDFARSQFDRVAQARRQAGSVFKPFVYAAALQSGAGLGDWLADLPLSVALGEDAEDVWEPQNEDGRFRGPVTVRAALESSLNVPTVRLAFAAGLENVASAAQAAGLEAEAGHGPALALGAVDVSPLELAAAYAALADGGSWHQPHGLAQVLDRAGREVAAREALSRRHAIDPDVAYLLTSMLEGVVDHGTGGAARRLGLRGGVAGKTGTSDGRRDSWFAGYSSDRVAVVWVGRDDNRPTRQSGSRAALPIWTRFMLAVRPAAGYEAFAASPGVVEVEIDPLSGELAGPQCPERKRELYLASRVPLTQCALFHSALPGFQLAGLTGAESLGALSGQPFDGRRYWAGTGGVAGDVLHLGTTPDGRRSHIVLRLLRPRAAPPAVAKREVVVWNAPPGSAADAALVNQN
jgi:penicillin-binding protein 1B